MQHFDGGDRGGLSSTGMLLKTTLHVTFFINTGYSILTLLYYQLVACCWCCYCSCCPGDDEGNRFAKKEEKSVGADCFVSLYI